MAGVLGFILLSDEAGDPNRPEIIAREEQRAAMAAKDRNLTDDGNWGREKRSSAW